MYLVWINPPTNFTFLDDSIFLKKILAGDINSLNLLVIYVSKTDLRLCFAYAKSSFSHDVAHIELLLFCKFRQQKLWILFRTAS